MSKTVLVTGASSGIGRAFCEAFAQQGDHLIMVSRTIDPLKELAKQLEETCSIKTLVIAKDLARKNAAFEILDEIKRHQLSVDILVNNAGINNSGAFLSIPFPQLQHEMALNMVTLTNLTYLFLQEMEKHHAGTIINVASIASFFPTPYESVYGATKAYVLAFSEALHYEYKDNGIKVFAICPGITKTNLFANKELDLSKARSPQQVVKTALKAINQNKHFAVDSALNMIQSHFPRLFPRWFVLKTTGLEGKKATNVDDKTLEE